MRSSRGMVLFAVLIFSAAAAAATGSDVLRERYRELIGNIDTNPFGMPLHVQSAEQGDNVSAEVFGVLDQPFAMVAGLLGEARRWCDFLLLNINVKSCTVDKDAAGEWLTLYIAPKEYKSPDEAYKTRYLFRASRSAQYVEVFLDAGAGPLGTRANRIHLEALGIDGRTLVHFTSALRLGAASHIAMSTYLATLGRRKTGFSRVPDASGKLEPVRGLPAMIERNVVRYFLALQVELETRALPAAGRFEQQMQRWYELTQRFPQLYDLPKADYMANKRRERDNQMELQRGIDRSVTP